MMARAGVCSRRDAEKLIADGRVALNGDIVREQGTKATADDLITLDGKPVLEPEPSRLWRYNKPAGLVTTHRDEKGRPTVFANLPKNLPRVVSVGRLDVNSEGLLLLTNDGALARHLELPATGWVRRYRVRAFGRVDQPGLDRLKHGITVEGVAYGPIEATIERQQGSNAWLAMALTGASGVSVMSKGNSTLQLTATSAIPEPSTTAAILGVCVIGLGVWRKRRKAATG